ncbi:MAG: 2TM domain-containing protein [Candidatus Marinimicrobia bacterium]|nr:2TM domain-containing protein [Candidatus Neomarinimicrobiota bacterium]MCF7829433.1 2TM domain-containing protein [Candidatus Neomarinimicrobiota bacterium]MCF7880919.1 2TM domain-containing protein [Candidatus Neomarinimicrobiota bacterium]
MSQESAQLVKENRGFRMHRLAYLCVIPLLVLINLTFVPEFLWFLFPMVGWGIGLTMHYLFGVRRLEDSGTTGQFSDSSTHYQGR